MKVPQQPSLHIDCCRQEGELWAHKRFKRFIAGLRKKDGHAVVLDNKLSSKPTHRARRGPNTPYKKLLALMKQGDGQMNIILAHTQHSKLEGG